MSTPSPRLPDAATELPDRWDPQTHERVIYAQWLSAGLFTADAARSTRAGGDRDPFCIIMPPPNVTAVLHVGHALNNTVQDVVARWRRMAGDETLWLPGTDHAGIATQNVVEKLIARDGLTRFDLGRAAFVERTARFVDETGGVILEQLRAIGASCDWSRTAYTLSPELSRAVREAFVRLHERGLVYRGHRVIHWCPRCLTSLSDEEAEFEDAEGALYHIRYPLADEPARGITVATTRPETMLGDVAVAVHPEDERYADLIGRQVRLPINGALIPIIADTYTDPAFGTGAVKITPAHDANDFEVGRRHHLPMPVVMDESGAMREGADAAGRVPADLAGRDRFEAREVVVSLLRELGALEKAERHAHAVRHCYRCHTVVEPRLSDQWFVRMAPLAAPALEAVRSGALRILPRRWEAVYVNWLEGIRDWNISRQLWWGHRVPVWYCEQGHQTVTREDPAACATCGLPVRQDPDVLDTWFSSWLFPLSTLGWPDEAAPDLRAFYPTDVLVTAPEILFFWVARMVMAGFAFLGRTPFHTVYLHGTARDTQHRKMSKSLGNGIDPLDVARLYGADAMRWTLVAGMGLGTDVIVDPDDLEKSFAPGRNFATKLWNIGRFLLQNVGGAPVRPVRSLEDGALTRADRWILGRLNAAIAECDAALGPARPRSGAWDEEEREAGLRLNDLAESARRFVWNELADWYLESTKARLRAGGEDAEVARAVLVHAFDQALRLLHPVIPYVTEALWQRLPGRRADEFLATAPWPTAGPVPPGPEEFEATRRAVEGIRALRAVANIPPGQHVRAFLVPIPGDDATRALALLADEAPTIGALARASVEAVPTRDPRGLREFCGAFEVDLPADNLPGEARARECARARQEHAGLEKQLHGLRARLGNESFLARARPDVIEAERTKEREWSTRIAQLAQKVDALCGA